MPEQKQVVAVRINVRDVRIAFLERDDMEKAAHERPVLIPGTMQIQLAPRVASAPLHGDGRLRYQVDRVDGYDVTFDHNKVPPKILAKMLGQEYDAGTGVRRSNVDGVPKAFAFGFVVDLTEGHLELTWLPKCKAAPANRNAQQTAGSVEYSTDSLTLTAMPLEYNGDYEYIADTSDPESGFTKDKAEAFFNEVLTLPPRSPNAPDAGDGYG